jgi:uncharacterized protein YodC (DUF2158 family)
MELTLGDCVRLKSGGPKMVVTAIAHPYDGNVFCQWRDGETTRGAHFHQDMLDQCSIWADENVFVKARLIKNETGRELKPGEPVYAQYVKDENGNFVWSAIESKKPEPKQETWRDRPPLL